MNAVLVDNIVKTYDKGKVLALNKVSFEVKQGELFGLIGADGAGKTTMFRILTTLLIPNSGRAEVLGLDVVKGIWEIRKMVGYMPGKFSLYQDLSITENLRFFATVFNTTFEKNQHLIEDIYVQLAPFKDRLAGKLSGGMKQKLALCCALIHEPKILFLDEPTTGVDPVSRKEFWDMLDRLKARGITIVVSTPYMDEAERCDRIALIQKGNILDIDTLQGILSKHKKTLFAVRSEQMFRLLNDLRQFELTESCFIFGEFLHLSLKNGEADIAATKAFLVANNHQNLVLKPILPNIEDAFIELMEDNHHAK
ncbi:MAG: ABC transporter ATP-binding protein [Chitinophagales bacterium]|nr:ABC transporter ATP-binding protein [Chitinophagales bacterium]